MKPTIQWLSQENHSPPRLKNNLIKTGMPRQVETDPKDGGGQSPVAESPSDRPSFPQGYMIGGCVNFKCKITLGLMPVCMIGKWTSYGGHLVWT